MDVLCPVRIADLQQFFCSLCGTDGKVSIHPRTQIADRAITREDGVVLVAERLEQLDSELFRKLVDGKRIREFPLVEGTVSEEVPANIRCHIMTRCLSAVIGEEAVIQPAFHCFHQLVLIGEVQIEGRAGDVRLMYDVFDVKFFKSML